MRSLQGKPIHFGGGDFGSWRGGQTPETGMICQLEQANFAVAFLFHDRNRQLFGVAMAVANLPHKFGLDVAGDYESVGFVVCGVDRGSRTQFHDPPWKRFRHQSVRN